MNPFVVFLIFVITWKILCRLTTGWCKSYKCLIGKTALVTGGNTGIGLETAKALACRGAKVIIADVNDCTSTVENIKNETKNQKIFAKHVDFQSFESVRELAKNLNETEEGLDILVNNAGIVYSKFDYTEDGYHKMMQVNVYSHFLLTHLLLDLLKKSAPSKIIFVGSILAFTTSFRMEDLFPKDTYLGQRLYYMNIYSKSKYCTSIVSKEFAVRLERFGVTSNALHPGCVQTNIHRAYNKSYKFNQIAIFLSDLLIPLKSAQLGMQTVLHLATVCEETGKFFADCIEFFQPPGVNNPEVRNKIWKEMERIVNLQPDEILDV